MITVKECLEILDRGEVVNLECVQYNRQKKKGGGVLNIEEAMILQKAKTIQGKATANRPPTSDETGRAGLVSAPDEKNRDPNHKFWYTRNVVICISGHPTSIIKKIHPLLLIRFNGIEVTL